MIITIILQGGMCNTLFQYLAVKNIVDKNKLDCIIQLDESELGNAATKRRFSLGALGLSSVIGANMFTPRFNESQFNYTDALEDFILKNHLKGTPETVIKGYFISHKYLNLDDVRKLSSHILPIKNLTAVHIRLGDYLSLPASDYHGNLSEDYYKKALSHLQKGDILHLFSDEPLKALERFPFLRNYAVIYNTQPVDPFNEILMMSRYEHLVIANSSFSLMAAYMSDPNHTKVVAPSKFFKVKMNQSDLFLPNWTLLEPGY